MTLKNWSQSWLKIIFLTIQSNYVWPWTWPCDLDLPRSHDQMNKFNPQQHPRTIYTRCMFEKRWQKTQTLSFIDNLVYKPSRPFQIAQWQNNLAFSQYHIIPPLNPWPVYISIKVMTKISHIPEFWKVLNIVYAFTLFIQTAVSSYKVW